MTQKLIALLIGATLLGSIGIARANAQTQETLIRSIDQIPMSGGEVTDHESDPVVETRNLRDEFKGIKLSPQQFEQIRQSRRQFRTELKQVMTGNFGGILQLIFLPKAEGEQGAGRIFGNPISNYSNAISRVLTPEQIKIWQQNLEQGARNPVQ